MSYARFRFHRGGRRSDDDPCHRCGIGGFSTTRAAEGVNHVFTARVDLFPEIRDVELAGIGSAAEIDIERSAIERGSHDLLSR
ncbi:hypothetical protein Mvan_2069 [Mycolicibacterium vanbaalenii PYR-1]|uniref:Uncharacterized protein n=1 Tax=Mycolicibacterium vanbaalenii (strain DSM 7251 / JCM 13017 / BCRC 16820 / KCTC 9966 / NRRL B-24157 / PYR-1) TaxID=350058 RepID=A1T6T4_MYCVP|nr:hypothetical protein Mvan_2069 [Mycolicibacterium vanbaalenii PYR-1]